MAIQVTTPQNFQQLIETGKVDAFVPPDVKAAETAPKAGENGTKKPDSPSAPADASKSAETRPRNADGTFTKAPDGDTSTRAGATPEDDEAGEDLPEKARKVIGKKHRLMKEAEEFAREQWRGRTAAEQRAEQLARENAELKTKSGPTPEKAQAPKPEDFKTVAEYTDALVSFRVAEERAKEKAEEAKQRADQEKAERERAFGKRIATAQAKYDDFEEVVKSLAGTDLEKVPLDVTEYIQESDQGAELLYHLAKHPDELDRLRKLSPRRFIAELGKLETKWESKPEPAAKLSELPAASVPAVSKAPAPVQALEGKNATVEKDPAKMTFQELREYDREQQLKRARR